MTKLFKRHQIINLSSVMNQYLDSQLQSYTIGVYEHASTSHRKAQAKTNEDKLFGNIS